MAPSNKIGAHQAYLDVWQRALEADRGIRIKVQNPVDYRGRLYHARAAERKHNLQAYPEEHVMHGKSYYDHLIVRLEEGALRIEKDCTAEIEEL